MTPPLHRPKPFSESEKARLDRIKKIALAEQEERERAEIASLWRESREEMWITEAFETRDNIRQQQENQRILDQVKMEVVISDIEG